MPSIYVRLGGHDAVKLAVDQLFERLIADPERAPYFAGKDVDRRATSARSSPRPSAAPSSTVVGT
jgi:truncated hemoglobin YjbI